MSNRSWFADLFGRTACRGSRPCGQSGRSRRPRCRPALERLEGRLAPAGYAVTAGLEVLPDGDGPPGRPVVFFESAVAGYQVLLKGLAADADAVVLDGQGDGLAQMAAFLKGRHGLSAIHVVSHGAPGALELGRRRWTRPP